jgi:aminopeptidase
MTVLAPSKPLTLDPYARVFPEFSLTRLLGTVFAPTQGCRISLLIDLENPELMKDFAFLSAPGHAVQKKAYEAFYVGLKDGGLAELGMTGGEMIAYRMTHGSNLDLEDECWDAGGRRKSLDRDVYACHDVILCLSTFSATAPLTAKCKEYGFRGATMHGLNDIILKTGLAVNYEEVSRAAEQLRLAMTRADSIEIDFGLQDGRVVTTVLHLGGQEAQKSHGLCRGSTPDVANLPAGEVYFVPVNASGQFPLKYADGTQGLMQVRNRNIVRADLIKGNPETIAAHNEKLGDDPMTGTLGELGFGTQVLPVAGADIQDEKILGTCHLATGRDDHLGGDILPGMFKRPENSSHDDILFAPHKTPDFDLVQVRMRRGRQEEVLIEHFRPSEYLMEAL